MKFLVGLAVLFLSSVSMGYAQTNHPDCAFASSDYDGDGWGYENNQTCVITDNSANDQPSAGECIDSDGDGWGWDGVKSCTTNVQQPAQPVNTFNEIDEIDEHFGVEVKFDSFFRSFKAAVVHCPAGEYTSAVTYYLTYDGSLYSVFGSYGQTDPDVNFGLWSTGISTKDTRVRVSIRGTYNTLLITESSVRSNGLECTWL